MTACADAWTQAQAVRTWMVQAEQTLAAGSSLAHIDGAMVSLAKARAAWTELGAWLAHMGQVAPPAPPALVDGFLRVRGTLPPPSILARTLAAKREAVALDLVEVDRIIDWLGVKQRAVS